MIHVLPEGRTEEKVIQKILHNQNYKVWQGERRGPREESPLGKSQLNPKLRTLIGDKHLVGVRCLLLRDLDAHDNETEQRIRQSIEVTIQNTLRELEYNSSQVVLSPLQGHTNVFTLVLSQPDIRLALHIATTSWQETFIKTTIDDYVLTLSLYEETVEALINSNGNGWSDVQSGEIVRKITDEISTLLTKNHIPLREAKDFVRLYAAVMQLHTSPPVFAEKVLAHAESDHINTVFASLKAAIDFLGGE